MMKCVFNVCGNTIRFILPLVSLLLLANSVSSACSLGCPGSTTAECRDYCKTDYNQCSRFDTSCNVHVISSCPYNSGGCCKVWGPYHDYYSQCTDCDAPECWDHPSQTTYYTSTYDLSRSGCGACEGDGRVWSNNCERCADGNVYKCSSSSWVLDHSCSGCVGGDGGAWFYTGCNGTSCKKEICPVVGQKCCGGDCFDLYNDPNNCGSCGNVCGGATPFCRAGGCAECRGDADCPGCSTCDLWGSCEVDMFFSSKCANCQWCHDDTNPPSCRDLISCSPIGDICGCLECQEDPNGCDWWVPSAAAISCPAGQSCVQLKGQCNGVCAANPCEAGQIAFCGPGEEMISCEHWACSNWNIQCAPLTPLELEAPEAEASPEGDGGEEEAVEDDVVDVELDVDVTDTVEPVDEYADYYDDDWEVDVPDVPDVVDDLVDVSDVDLDGPEVPDVDLDELDVPDVDGVDLDELDVPDVGDGDVDGLDLDVDPDGPDLGDGDVDLPVTPDVDVTPDVEGDVDVDVPDIDGDIDGDFDVEVDGTPDFDGDLDSDVPDLDGDIDGDFDLDFDGTPDLDEDGDVDFDDADLDVDVDLDATPDLDELGDVDLDADIDLDDGDEGDEDEDADEDEDDACAYGCWAECVDDLDTDGYCFDRTVMPGWCSAGVCCNSLPVTCPDVESDTEGEIPELDAPTPDVGDDGLDAPDIDAPTPDEGADAPDVDSDDLGDGDVDGPDVGDSDVDGLDLDVDSDGPDLGDGDVDALDVDSDALGDGDEGADGLDLDVDPDGPGDFDLGDRVVGCTSYSFALQWGGSGSGFGQFNNPAGIAVSSSEDVYVVDSGNNRIQKFTETGNFLREVTYIDFTEPTGIAFRSNGNYFVAGLLGEAVPQYVVLEFDSSDNYLRTIADFTYRLNLPKDVAVSSDKIFIASTDPGEIFVFDIEGAFLRKWTVDIIGEIIGSYPTGVSVDSAGIVYVADNGNQKIKRFYDDGTPIDWWYSPRGEKPLWDVFTDSYDLVYVPDHLNDVIEKYTPDGTFISSFGESGSGDGEFNTARYMFETGLGTAYISDSGNNRVQVFTCGTSLCGPRDANLDVGNDTSIPWEWSVSGLDDFAERVWTDPASVSGKINNILRKGCLSSNCPDCRISDGNCLMPFAFKTKNPLSSLLLHYGGEITVEDINFSYQVSDRIAEVAYGNRFRFSEGANLTVNYTASASTTETANYVIPLGCSHNCNDFTYIKDSPPSGINAHDVIDDALYRLLDEKLDISPKDGVIEMLDIDDNGVPDTYFDAESMWFEIQDQLGIQSLWGPTAAKLIIWSADADALPVGKSSSSSSTSVFSTSTIIVTTSTVTVTTTSTTTTSTTSSSTTIPENCCNEVDDDVDGLEDGQDSECQNDVALISGGNSVCWGTDYNNYYNDNDYYSGYFICPAEEIADSIHFYQNTQFGPDVFYVYTSTGTTAYQESGYKGDETISVSAENTNKIRFRFVTDSSITNYGVQVYSISCETTTTSITTTSSSSSTTIPACPTEPAYPSDKWDRVWCNSAFTVGLSDTPDQASITYNDNWGSGQPIPGYSDNVGFRSGRTITFSTTGSYQFSVGSDDGTRLWLDGGLIIDNWGCCHTRTTEVPVTAGDHQLRIDFREDNGGAWTSFDYAQITTTTSTTTTTIIPCPLEPSYPSDRWDRVWCNSGFTQFFSDVPDQVSVMYNDDWGSGELVPGHSDGTGFRAGRTVSFPVAGTYQFIVGSDDGTKLWLDGVLLIDNWGCCNTRTTEVPVTAGDHQLRIDFREDNGGAWTSFDYAEVTTTTSTTVPSENCCNGVDDDLDGLENGQDSECQLDSSLSSGSNSICWWTDYNNYYNYNDYYSGFFECPSGEVVSSVGFWQALQSADYFYVYTSTGSQVYGGGGYVGSKSVDVSGENTGKVRFRFVSDGSGTNYGVQVNSIGCHATTTSTTTTTLSHPPYVPWFDDFNDNSLDPVKWVKPVSSWNNAVEQNQCLEVTSTSSGSAIVMTEGSYDLRDRQALVKVVQHSSDGGFKVSKTFGNGVHWPQWDIYEEANYYNYHLISGNRLQVYRKKSGSGSNLATSGALTVPYWLRIRVSEATVYFEYVNNSVSEPSEGEWVTLYSEAWNLATPLSDLYYLLFTAYNTPSKASLHVDDFKLI